MSRPTPSIGLSCNEADRSIADGATGYTNYTPKGLYSLASKIVSEVILISLGEVVAQLVKEFTEAPPEVDR